MRLKNYHVDIILFFNYYYCTKRGALLYSEASTIDVVALDYADTWFNRKLHFIDIIAESGRPIVRIYRSLRNFIAKRDLTKPRKGRGRVGDDNLSR